MIITIHKPIGKTPLDMISKLKESPNFKHKKMSYAGRLDPMAHGILVLLTETDCFKQSEFHNLDKEYIFDILIGISTDTYDILGDIISKQIVPYILDINKCKSILYSNLGEQEQYYPPYSSQRVNGKPLWWYAKHKLLHTITIPKKKITIYELDLLHTQLISKNEIITKVTNDIRKINPNYSFRQNDILDKWSTIYNIPYHKLTIKAKVSSGTYIRSICNEFGKSLGIPCIAYNIHRTRVGSYSDSIFPNFYKSSL